MTHFDLVASKIGAKLIFSTGIVVEKSLSLRNVKYIFANLLKSGNCFCTHFKTLSIFWDQKPNLTIFEGEEGGGEERGEGERNC